MLTITRKPGEVVRVGEEIRLRVVRITPTRTEIAIECPDSLRIIRGERADRIEAERREAGSVKAG